MIRLFPILLFCGLAVFGQRPATPDQEEVDLRQVLSDDGASNLDLIRGLEEHLAKFPDSRHRFDIERALARASMAVNDNPRIVLYGERVLARQPDDLTLLDRVTRALVATPDPANMKQALVYSRRMEQAIAAAANQAPPAGVSPAHRKDQIDRETSRALLYQAIASEHLGDLVSAVALARRSFEAYPASEPAAELGRCLAETGKMDAAIRAYADAFIIPDANAEDADRVVLRQRLGDLYRKAKGSETGLGDIVLEAYDRDTALLAARRAALSKLDPNFDVTNPMQFTISSLDGDRLNLESLRGKVVIMDFWATWCGPCRAQHPLYAQVMKNFAGRSDVVFLSIDTDEDHGLVPAFVKKQGWTNKIYFEDGLSGLLRVSSIPATLVFDRKGTLVSRMDGYDPDRFVAMLTDRIREALK
jgi:thiol-disulfide isomerase/thioredoxin